MVARFCLGIGQEVYSIPVLVDGASFLFSQVPGQSVDRSTGLSGGQHNAWVLCGLKVMALPYKEDGMSSQDPTPSCLLRHHRPQTWERRLQPRVARMLG